MPWIGSPNSLRANSRPQRSTQQTLVSKSLAAQPVQTVPHGHAVVLLQSQYIRVDVVGVVVLFVVEVELVVLVAVVDSVVRVMVSDFVVSDIVDVDVTHPLSMHAQHQLCLGLDHPNSAVSNPASQSYSGHPYPLCSQHHSSSIMVHSVHALSWSMADWQPDSMVKLLVDAVEVVAEVVVMVGETVVNEETLVGETVVIDVVVRLVSVSVRTVEVLVSVGHPVPSFSQHHWSFQPDQDDASSS